MSMSKTLYISDLDGTLLNSSAEISSETQKMINRFISEGGYFSVATARTVATAVPITQNIAVNVPVVLMNGVCIYDTVKKEYVKIENIPFESLTEALSILHGFDLSGFMFSINGNVLDTYYENLNSEHAREFYEERTRKFGKLFIKTDDFLKCTDKNIVYYSVTDRYEVLTEVYHALRNIRDIHIDFYRDVYREEYWYLEISSSHASKYNAVNYIRNKYGFDRIIGFGDNLNDLPLFRACDESYAVENAKEEVKNAASGIIPSNNNNGVALKICGYC